MIGAVALIDDNWKYIKQSCDIGMHGVLFNKDNTYNWSRPSEVPTNCTVAHTWTDVKRVLLKLKEAK